MLLFSLKSKHADDNSNLTIPKLIPKNPIAGNQKKNINLFLCKNWWRSGLKASLYVATLRWGVTRRWLWLGFQRGRRWLGLGLGCSKGRQLGSGFGEFEGMTTSIQVRGSFAHRFLAWLWGSQIWLRRKRPHWIGFCVALRFADLCLRSHNDDGAITCAFGLKALQYSIFAWNPSLVLPYYCSKPLVPLLHDARAAAQNFSLIAALPLLKTPSPAISQCIAALNPSRSLRLCNYVLGLKKSLLIGVWFSAFNYWCLVSLI